MTSQPRAQPWVGCRVDSALKGRDIGIGIAIGFLAGSSDPDSDTESDLHDSSV
jgi:hypothetical protein